MGIFETDSRCSQPAHPWGEKYLYFAAWAGIASFGLFALAHYIYWIVNPFPNEFREGVSLDIVNLLIRGINPFSPEAPPSFFYMYGFLNAWLIAGLGWLVDDNSYVLHRLISVTCTVASGVLIAWEVRRQTRSRVLTLLAFLLMLVTSRVNNEASARPDQLGLLVTVAGLVVANRVKRLWGVFLLAILVVVAFYAKQYFLILGVEIFVYLAVVNRIRALWFGVMSGLVLVGSLVLVNKVYPDYFAMTVLAFGGSGMSTKYMMRQFFSFGSYYFPLLVFSALSFRHLLRRENLCIRPAVGDNPNSKLAPPIVEMANLGIARNWTVYHSSILVAGLALLHLGQCDGAQMSYFYQLLLPGVVVVGLSALHAWCPVRWRWPVVLLLCVCSLFHNFRANCNFTPFLTPKEKAAWHRAQEILDQERNREVCLLVPLFVDYAIKGRVAHYQNGHNSIGVTADSDWLALSWNRMLEKAPRVAEFMFPTVPAMVSKIRICRETLQTKIDAKQFALIVTLQHDDMKGDSPLERNYRLVETLTLRAGVANWNCEFWRPRE